MAMQNILRHKHMVVYFPALPSVRAKLQVCLFNFVDQSILIYTKENNESATNISSAATGMSNIFFASLACTC